LPALASPYDPGPERLREALKEAPPAIPANATHSDTAILWLPTVNDRPVASSPLIAELPDATTMAELKPWTVAALRLAPEASIDLLCACMGKETLAAGLIVGKTL